MAGLDSRVIFKSTEISQHVSVSAPFALGLAWGLETCIYTCTVLNAVMHVSMMWSAGRTMEARQTSPLRSPHTPLPCPYRTVE
jgi:hypothetical protein